MNIQRLHTIILRASALALLLVAGVTLGACGVTDPDASAWQNASAYSWPVDLGSRSFSYRQIKLTGGTVTSDDINVFNVDGVPDDNKVFAGQPMYKLGKKYYFLPLRDTLVINDLTPVTLALVAPLEKGHTWICAYDDATPTWSASIVDRYSYRNIEGTVYKNVIEVKYTPLLQHDINNGESWVRFFAEGIGPVQTIQLYNTPPSAALPAKIELAQRVILIPSTSN